MSKFIQCGNLFANMQYVYKMELTTEKNGEKNVDVTYANNKMTIPYLSFLYTTGF
jgi:hypothetical protein